MTVLALAASAHVAIQMFWAADFSQQHSLSLCGCGSLRTSLKESWERDNLLHRSGDETNRLSRSQTMRISNSTERVNLSANGTSLGPSMVQHNIIQLSMKKKLMRCKLKLSRTQSCYSAFGNSAGITLLRFLLARYFWTSKENL